MSALKKGHDRPAGPSQRHPGTQHRELPDVGSQEDRRGGRGLTWTRSRSSFHRQMVNPFFRGSREKWLLGIERAKMVTTGGPSMHLQKASKLSRQWGPLHIDLLMETR